jgi:hypothetical protein
MTCSLLKRSLIHDSDALFYNPQQRFVDFYKGGKTLVSMTQFETGSPKAISEGREHQASLYYLEGM